MRKKVMKTCFFDFTVSEDYHFPELCLVVNLHIFFSRNVLPLECLKQVLLTVNQLKKVFCYRLFKKKIFQS